ncbi:helix-turn-helix domain-containing protein [Leclercia adecarboxylata]|uniref:Inhibitor of hydrogen peroxide resistance n=1 Tax=Leclercia barmai TaxID=2785629 RepID=A0ABS7RVN0_9ENTR|nr:MULTISPECIES: helix-turn-helix domain-containing protein [Enterobacteriaceae]MBZ0058350.1 helix-turn-helix domain-containing protein [Leclercia sp. EMC7]MCM5697777.1 helix-turn-helix domain-containing protein [Leclercia sp. LTM01]MCM5700908.1 helix-turn-helix domain-containing protein [Leclercia sp. LTM14]QCZ28145.1 transcriptional regulator [Leclercia adecarboxylata]TLU65001.1 transcriptional regulator [Enterobacter sp. MF024]
MNRYAKPISEFSRLEHCLASHSTPFKLPAMHPLFGEGDRENDNAVVLQSGTLSIHRQQDDLLIEIVAAPYIFGLNAGMMGCSTEYLLVTQSPCTGFWLPAASARQLIQQAGLWSDAFCWLSWHHRMMEIRDKQLVGNNSYSQIRSTLLDMAQWDEGLRMRVGVMNYIQRRTRISRSVVAEVLAALRQGNYIMMERGKLIGINHLPAEY